MSAILTPELQQEVDDLLLKVRIAHRWLKAFSEEKKTQLVGPSIVRTLPHCARLLIIVTRSQSGNITRVERAAAALHVGDESTCKALLAQCDIFTRWREGIHDCVQTYQEDVGKWYDFVGVKSADRSV